jgi:hypothetical protein
MMQRPKILARWWVSTAENAPVPPKVSLVTTCSSAPSTLKRWFVQFAPGSSVVIVPPWYTYEPRTKSSLPFGPLVAISNEPPLM